MSLSLALEIEKHDAVSEFRMASYDSSARHDRFSVEPKFGANAAANTQRHHQLDIATTTAQVCSLDDQRHVAVFFVKFYLDADGKARMNAPIVFGENCGERLQVGRIHGSSPEPAGHNSPSIAPVFIIGRDLN